MRKKIKSKKIGQFIKEMREYKGMKITTLAEKAGTTKGYISELESGKKDKPSFDWIKKIANALEVTIEYFTNNNYTSISEAAKLESLKLFCVTYNIPHAERIKMGYLCHKNSGYETVNGWKIFLESLKLMKEFPKKLLGAQKQEVLFPD